MRCVVGLRRVILPINQLINPCRSISHLFNQRNNRPSTVHISQTLYRPNLRTFSSSSVRCNVPDQPTDQSTFPSDSPFVHIAIVGCGPAGFYTAKYLLKANPSIRIDLIDRLPVPFGLVRFGVAPDHPEVKSVTHDFQTVMNDSRVRFIGNLEISDQPASVNPSNDQSTNLTSRISLGELRSYYHGVVLSYGAQSERTLSLPNAHLSNIMPARSFVNWYNGHPDHQSEPIDLTAGSSALIIGQGNVAIDCARVLLGPLEHFAPTDITPQAFEAIKHSSINEVRLVGRRGPLQSAFTTAEFREICHMNGIQPVLDPAVLAEAETGKGALELQSNRPKKRKMALMKDVANKSINQSNAKKLYFDFFLSPVEFVENPAKPGFVGAVRCEKMRLEWTDNADDCFDCRSIGTGQLIDVPANLVLESIGYRSLPIDQSLPFDRSTHTISSINGRVQSMPDVYVSGWLKRGPTGIIGSNIADARETVASIINDLPRLETKLIDHRVDVINQLTQKGCRVVDKEGWKRIDQYETSIGQSINKNRLKLTDISPMLAIAEGAGH